MEIEVEGLGITRDRVLGRYINHVYGQSFYPAGTCLGKSIRIVKAARKLGHNASLMVCISRLRHSAFFGLPGCFLHFYSLVDGVKVDVAFDPETERKRMRNEDVKMTRGIPIENFAKNTLRRLTKNNQATPKVA